MYGHLSFVVISLMWWFAGNRDVVGWGFNGTASYVDREEYPMPAVRFKENTPDVMALREKEKGDWKSLTLEEKKACKFLSLGSDSLVDLLFQYFFVLCPTSSLCCKVIGYWFCTV